MPLEPEQSINATWQYVPLVNWVELTGIGPVLRRSRSHQQRVQGAV
jgi:hypothetical protein